MESVRFFDEFPAWFTLRMDELTVLALRAKAGDRTALNDLVAESRPAVWRLCRFLGSPEGPDDLTQETYERALGALHRFRGDGSARAWLLAIARRVCVDATRRSQRRRLLTERVVATTTFDLHTDDSWMETDELLAALDHERREAFVLTQFVGLSYDEAAAIAGCPVGTIRSRVARARADLLAAHHRDTSPTS